MNLFEKPKGVETRWASFENPTAGRGTGGRENRGGKGHAFDSVEPGQTQTLLDVSGSGTVTRIWLTVTDRSPQILRSLKLEMFWDGAENPAVSVPLGDFFGIGLGRTAAFECVLFSNPEGRSFCCFVPMPFRTGAKITLTNESETRLPHLFYDVDLLLGVEHSPDALFFHAGWRRERPNALGKTSRFSPESKGAGGFSGATWA